MNFKEFDLFIADLPKGPAMNLLTSHPRISLAIKWYTYNRVPLHSNTTLKSLMKALPFRAVLYFSIVHTGDKEGVSVPEHFRNILIKMWSRGAAISSENHKVAVHFSCRIERILISR